MFSEHISISHLVPYADLVPLVLKLTFNTRLHKSIIYTTLLRPWGHALFKYDQN